MACKDCSKDETVNSFCIDCFNNLSARIQDLEVEIIRIENSLKKAGIQIKNVNK